MIVFVVCDGFKRICLVSFLKKETGVAGRDGRRREGRVKKGSRV